jgi:uncharacterized protein
MYRTGWIYQRFHLIPFSRIQHAVVVSGPIERKYGIASLKLYTAAGDTKDISIPGLRSSFAEQLKQMVIQKTQSAAADEGLD